MWHGTAGGRPREELQGSLSARLRPVHNDEFQPHERHWREGVTKAEWPVTVFSSVTLDFRECLLRGTWKALIPITSCHSVQ